MKKFIVNTLFFISAFFVIVFFLLLGSSIYRKSKNFTNYNTESNTLWLKENNKYDILFMGVSHARNFSRHKNHLRMEKMLHSKIANIAQGYNMCGVNEQLFYLDYFYYKGNTTSKIIYVLSPPMLFSETLPKASNTFKYETFEIPFLLRYFSFESENKFSRVMSYLQWNLHPKRIFSNPYTKESMNAKLDTVNMKNIKKGQNIAYSGTGLNFTEFNKSIKIVEQTILLAKKNNSQVILLIPPALFGKWRGHEETLAFANSIKKIYSNVNVFDGSETVLKPELYYDNHHLNTKGVVYFTNKELQPLLEKLNK